MVLPALILPIELLWLGVILWPTPMPDMSLFGEFVFRVITFSISALVFFYINKWYLVLFYEDKLEDHISKLFFEINHIATSTYPELDHSSGTLNLQRPSKPNGLIEQLRHVLLP
jgi:hypothetical protein